MKIKTTLWNEMKSGMAMLGSIAFLMSVMELLGFEDNTLDNHFRAKFIVCFFMGFMIVKMINVCFLTNRCS